MPVKQITARQTNLADPSNKLQARQTTESNESESVKQN